MKGKVLVVDDNKSVLTALEMLLQGEFEKVYTLADPANLISMIRQKQVDVILLDMNFRAAINTGNEGIHWLRRIFEIDPTISVVLITAFGDVELAVRALKEGAFDFILKPWTNEKFLATIHGGLSLSRSKQKVSMLESAKEAIERDVDQQFGPIIGTSKAMREVMNIVDKVSVTDANILILGENGIGKQHLAREIHRRSEFRSGPFVHVDLGSLSETLFESELFGHKKGAFTDAHQDKPGRFELAEGGTLFLDEIGNLPYNLQSKLLTVIQDRKVSRLGEGIERPFNARLLFATNAPLNQWVAEGKFRQDLMFRINTVEMEIPPLRQRPEDVSEFIAHFLKVFRAKYHKSHLTIEKDAMDALEAHHWPGNVREVQHTIERGVIMSDGNEIRLSDFNLSSLVPQRNSPAEFESLNLQDAERVLVEKAVEKYQGNISKAAKELGLTRAALYRRLEKYNL